MSVRLVLGLLGMLAVVFVPAAQDRPGGRGSDDVPTARPEGTPLPAAERVEVRGIENLYRLSPNLYSGGQPEGDAGFEALKQLGIRTIVSVDGARPDVEAARRMGLRYVHLPVGYDGIPREQAVRLVKAVKERPGPVFVHCHHGKHRGPAAAALCGMSTEGWSRNQARLWLERAGTDPKYNGLFATVDRFVPPSTKEWERVGPGELPERAGVPALVEAMVEIDRLWDRLKAIEKAGFRTPPDQADLDPPHEALMLAEQFREAIRHEDAKAKGAEFSRMIADSEQRATALEAALRKIREGDSPATKGEVEAAFARLGRSCTDCHARFRDRPDPE